MVLSAPVSDEAVEVGPELGELGVGPVDGSVVLGTAIGGGSDARPDKVGEGAENGTHGHGAGLGAVLVRSSGGKSAHADDESHAGATDWPPARAGVVALVLVDGPTPPAMGVVGHITA